MRFVLDMGLARRTAEFLRTKEHDATHLRDQGLQRLSDVSIVEKALVERRVILTHDLDFGRIVALSRGQLPSVITFRLTDMRFSMRLESALLLLRISCDNNFQLRTTIGPSTSTRSKRQASM